MTHVRKQISILQVLAPYVNAAGLSSDTANNQCTDANMPDVSKRTFSCAERTCEVLQIRRRVITDCFSLEGLDCGETHRIAESLCYSLTISELVPLTEPLMGTPCETLSEGSALEACTEVSDPCPSFFYQYDPWETCSARCNATSCPAPQTCELSGQQTRTSTCATYVSGAVVSTAMSDCASLSKLDSQSCGKKCFNPLMRFTKTEGMCVSTQCDEPGTRMVEYAACTDSRGCQQRPNVTSAQTMAVSCPPAPCDPCAAVSCSEPGTASQQTVDGVCKCTCNSGYTGSRCHVEEGRSYNVLSADGSECTSGVLDVEGTCCATEDVDGCGYCAGAVVSGMGSVRVGFDINGDCCSGGDDGVFLTTSFTCCLSLSQLDECGVCGGSSDTCSKAVSSSLQLGPGYGTGAFVTELKARFPADVAAAITDDSATDSRRRLQQGGVSAVATLPAGFSTSAAELMAAFVRTGISAANNGNLTTQPASPQARMQGTPGNGVCETGEVAGSTDCPLPQSCPMPTAMDDGEILGNAARACAGKGVCVRASGSCRCPPGYIGDACDRCDAAEGYVAVPTSSGNACTRLAQDFVTPTTPTDPVMPPAPPAEVDEDGGISTGAIVGIVVGAVGGVAIISGVAYYVLRVRGAKEVSPV